MARLILDVLAALELTDVTLVGNDTGGALCQFTIDTDATRIGRLVLTNCDAFEQFPPPPFGGLIVLGRRPGRLRFAMRTMRPKLLRHSILGYGGLVATPLDPALSARWAAPCVENRAIAADTARFLRGVDEPERLADEISAFSTAPAEPSVARRARLRQAHSRADTQAERARGEDLRHPAS